MHKLSPGLRSYAPLHSLRYLRGRFFTIEACRDHASGPALAVRAAGHLQFRAPERHGPEVRLPLRRGRDHRDRRRRGGRAGPPRHHLVARPPGRERHGRGRGDGRARPLPPDAGPDGRQRSGGQRLGQAHPDGARHRRVAVPGEHGAHPRQGEGARRVRPAGHGGLRLHPAHARLLRPAAVRRRTGRTAAWSSSPCSGARSRTWRT